MAFEVLTARGFGEHLSAVAEVALSGGADGGWSQLPGTTLILESSSAFFFLLCLVSLD